MSWQSVVTVTVVLIAAVSILVSGGVAASASVVADGDARLESNEACAAIDSPGELPGESNSKPRIVELYPNPTTDHNVGEYLTVAVPPDTDLGNLTVTDGHTTAHFPNETGSGPIAASTDKTATESLTDDPVVELEGTIRLAVDGDDLELKNEDEVVDRVSYQQAPLAERWHRTDTQGSADADGIWHPQDGTCLSVSRADPEQATAFVLPDSPEVPTETLQGAEDRILLAGYTITSDSVTDELIDAADRDVEVAVLFESSPVGGTPQASDDVLERLEAADVDVRAIGGEGARYRFHHPKYAIADDTVLVTSENWKPSGVGGASSRGWGVQLTDADLASDLETIFRADFSGWDTQPADDYRSETSFVEDDHPEDRPTFPTEHTASELEVETVSLLVAPDNAEEATLEYLASADDEILIKQASIADDAAVLEATIEAARRGVDVRVLLDSTWYHEDENDALREELTDVASEEGLPLEAELVDDTDSFEKIHAKGVIIDREVAIVGSANWNQNAFENNREVLLSLHGEEVGEYYASVFEADWEANGESWSLPIELSVSVFLALALAALVGYRYLQFGDERTLECD